MTQASLFKSDGISLSSSFNRSTNLELDFDDVNRLKDIFVSPKFQSGMIEILEAVNEENSNQRVRVLSGSPGLGKSTFALFGAHTISQFDDATQKLITKKINSAEGVDSKRLQAVYKAFQKNKRSLLPVFLNGHMGNIEDAFLGSLKKAMTSLLDDGDKVFDSLIKDAAKNQNAIITKWKKHFPQIYQNYLELLEVEGEAQDLFEKGLRSGTAKSREVFERIYCQITGGAGSEKSIGDVVGIFKQATRVLKDQFGIDGIFVVYDEFGKYLEKGIHTPSALNIQFLQDFAEFCDRSGEYQCHLTLITHMSVSQYASQLPVTIQREWAKIEGRFAENTFFDKGTNYFKMIERVFTQTILDTDVDSAKKVEKRVKSFLSSLKKSGNGLEELVATEDINTLLVRCYPLHPMTVALLPYLSQRVAQNERTMYTFLTRDEDHSLKRFLDTRLVGETIEFLMPIDLYQYFAPLIAKDNGIGGAFRVHLMMEEALNAIAKDDIVSRNVLSVLALSSIVKNSSYLPCTEEFIVAALQDSFDSGDIKKSIESLLKNKTLFFNRINKTYELQQGSSVDIQEEINTLKEVKLTSRDLIKIIKRYYPQDYLAPKRYNFENAITRFLRTEILSVEELKLGRYEQKPDFEKEDGLLYFIVPFDRDELDLARKLIAERENELVIFVLPKKFVECRRDIEELNAINSLYSNKEMLNSSPLVKKELDRHRDITLSSIFALLDPVVGKFSLEVEVHYPKAQLRMSIDRYAQLEKKVGDIFEREYSKTLIFNNELVNKHKIAGAVTLGRKILCDAMTTRPELSASAFGIEGNGPEVSMYKTLSRISGVQYRNDLKRFIFKGRDDVKVQSFINLFEGYKEILRSKPEGITFQELTDTLIAPPYGLRKGLIPLLVCLFDQSLEHPVNHYFDGEYIQALDGNHYDLLMKHPKLGKLQYTEISKVRQDFLKMLAKNFSVEGDPTVSVLTTGLYAWRQKIPNYSRSCDEISEISRKLLIFIDTAKEPDRLIFIKIPEALGFSPVTDETKPSVISKMEEALSASIDESISVYQKMIKRLHGSFIDFLFFIQETCLGEKRLDIPNGANLAVLYKDSWAKLPKDVRGYTFSSETKRFINRFTNSDTTKRVFLFVEDIADSVVGITPRRWERETESLFNFNLTKIQNEVEMVCEFMSEKFKGQSAVAFINREDGQKQFMRLGVKSELNDDLKKVQNQIDELLSSYNQKDRNNILMDLLSASSDPKHLTYENRT